MIYKATNQPPDDQASKPMLVKMQSPTVAKLIAFRALVLKEREANPNISTDDIRKMWKDQDLGPKYWKEVDSILATGKANPPPDGQPSHPETRSAC